MKHNSTKYRRRTTKRRSSKRPMSRRHISKRRISKRRISKRRYTQKYRLRGGEKTSVAIQTPDNPTPGQSPAEASKANIEASKAQNEQVKTMSGGKRTRTRSGSKRTRTRSGSKRVRRVKYNQRGGLPAAVPCVSGCNPDASGYGCLPPSGCMAVAVVNNEDAQQLNIIAKNIDATGAARGQYDTRVR